MRTKLKTLAQEFIADESGLSAVEYGLLAAGIAVGLWTIISQMRTDLRLIFTSMKTDIADAAP